MNEESLFAVAVEKATWAERQAFLDQACAGDDALRRRLERLLAGHERASGILDHSLGDDLAPGPQQAPQLQSMAEGPGMVIGPYKLLEQIGEGGFGVVFMAEQTEPVRRKVALKILKAGMDTRHVVARFEAERQALAILDHPNIARVFDGGTTRDRGQGSGVGEDKTDALGLTPNPCPLTPAEGRPYFVMELVKGVPITDFCDQNHLTPRQRLELFVPVCQAIQHAHQKGIIHRDVKPSNVLVTVHDTTPVPKIIDFGVAKALGQELTDKTLFTGFAQMVGTPLYMSPEQAGQSGLDIDTRSDIYSLGVLLYELLTGTTPFDKERFKQAAYDEICRIIREEDPPKPSTRLSESKDTLPSISAQRQTEPARLTKLVRGELDWIVMKALEKDRNRRYETALALAADVERFLRDEPVYACPPSAGYRLRKLARRNKGVLAIIASVLLALAATAASIGWAVRDRTARQTESEQAESIRRAKVEHMARDSLEAARTLTAENKLAAAREKLVQARTQLGNDAAALGNLAAEVATAAAELDRLQQFLDLIDRAHQAETTPLIGATLTADKSPGNTGTTIAKAEGRRPAAAVPFLLTALQRYDVLERDDWHNTLGEGFLGESQIEQVTRLAYEELLWLADDVLSQQQEHRSGAKLTPEAAARQALGYLGKAENAHRPTQALYRLRARCRKALKGEAAAQADTQQAAKIPPTLAVDYFLRGRTAFFGNRLPEAVEAFEAALRVEPTHYWSMMWLGACLSDPSRGPDALAGAARVFSGCLLKRPDHAHVYWCRAILYVQLRRYEDAVDDSSKVIELDPKHAGAWHNRGVAYGYLNQLDKALANLSTAVELDPDHAVAWHDRGIAYAYLNEFDNAVADLSKAVKLDPNYVAAWYDRGAAYNRLNRPQDALADYTKAIDLDPGFVSAWHNRGVTYSLLRQPENALSDLSRAIQLNPKHLEAWYNRGNVHGGLRQFEKALADYTQAIDLNPKHVQAWNNRGRMYQELGQLEKAVADYSRAIELDQKLALAWKNRGAAYNRLGEPAKAVADCLKAVELAPTQARYWKELGMAQYRAGDWKAAVDALDKSLQTQQGGDGVTWLFLAMAHKKLGAHEDARKAYEHAVSWQEGNKAALAKDEGLMDELRRLGREAAEVLELKKK
jgi:tetratricopeptide (TPR) repeat protein